MKTVKEWLSELPDGYRERALANMIEIESENKEVSISESIYGGFVWGDTPEGNRFWMKVQIHYATKGRKPLPPLP